MARRAKVQKIETAPKIDTAKIKEGIDEVKKAYSMCRDSSINNVLSRAIEKLQEALPPTQ